MRSQERSRNRDRGGFTLTELMITVSLIGVLAAIAIPNFMTYQARARRSEGMSNVSGIARAYKSYHAESGKFPDIVAESGEASLPDPALYGGLRPVTMDWDNPTETFFKMVGWRPEGNVFYSYEINSTRGCDAGCTDATCFTVVAHGDVDGDGSLGAVVLVHPLKDASGTAIGECRTAIGLFGNPVQPVTALPIHDEPAVPLAGADSY